MEEDDSNGTDKRGKNLFTNLDDVFDVNFAYLTRAFYQGLEGGKINRFSLQFTPDGLIKCSLNIEQTMADGTVSGYVTYASGETLHGICNYLDDGLAYGDLELREDKYYVKQAGSVQIRAKTAVKRKLK